MAGDERNPISIPAKPRTWARNAPKITTALVEEIRAVYRSGEASIGELAFTYDLAMSTVFYLVRYEQKPPWRTDPEEEAAAHIGLMEAEKTANVLARILPIIEENLEHSDYNPRLRDVCMVLLTIILDSRREKPILGE